MASESELSDVFQDEVEQSSTDDDTQPRQPSPTPTTSTVAPTESTIDPGDTGSVYNAPKGLAVPATSTKRTQRQARLTVSQVRSFSLFVTVANITRDQEHPLLYDLPDKPNLLLL